MISNEKQPFIEKVLDYVLIFWCIVTIVFYVIFLLNIKYRNYQNEEISSISASAYSRDYVTPYDNITDLTGTTWEFYQWVDFSVNTNYYLDFISNNSTFNEISLSIPFANVHLIYYISPSSTVSVYEEGLSGYEEDYRTITITGGTDATNTDLIAWLQVNATQVLSGYTSTINLTNCSSNKSSESGLSGSYTATITANTGYYLSNVTTTLGSITFSNNNTVATITILDVNDDFTISATASLIYHNIFYNLGNVVVISNKPTQIDEISNISITFQPYANYVLPQFINVEGVSSYIWDDDIGVLYLSNAFDDVVISINAEYKSGEYTFVELVDSVTLVPVNTFFNLFDFEIFGVNIYNILLSSLVLFVIIKVILKIFK